MSFRDNPEPIAALPLPEIHEEMAVVDKTDKVLYKVGRLKKKPGKEQKAALLKEGKFYRCVYVFFVDIKRGEIVFQRRAEGISNPLTLCPSASGHVKWKQSYIHAAIMETREEIGVHHGKEKFKPVGKINGKKNSNPFYSIHIVHFDGDMSIFKTEPKAVHSLEKLTIKEADKLFRQRKGVPQVGKRFKEMWFRHVREMLSEHIKIEQTLKRNHKAIRKLVKERT